MGEFIGFGVAPYLGGVKEEGGSDDKPVVTQIMHRGTGRRISKE